MDSKLGDEGQDRSHLAVIEDPTVKVKPGTQLQKFIESQFPSLPQKSYLSIGDIKELYAAVQKEKGICLNELMQGSEIILPQLVIPPRNPVLEKRINELKKSLAQKEYNRMTRDVDLTNRYKPTDSIGFQMKQINSGLIGVFQFVVTVAAAFLFGFMGIEVFSSVAFELAVKILLGIICALLVACAELYFLVRTLDFAEAPQERSPIHPTSLPSKKQLKMS